MSLTAAVLHGLIGGGLVLVTYQLFKLKARLIKGAPIMAHKYWVELSRPGYGGETHYSLFADKVKFCDSDRIHVTAGAANWVIHNVRDLTDVTTGRPMLVTYTEPLKAKAKTGSKEQLILELALVKCQLAEAQDTIEKIRALLPW